jgi:hypothetical protein
MVFDPITKSFSGRSPQFNAQFACRPLRAPRTIDLFQRDQGFKESRFQVKGFKFKTLPACPQALNPGILEPLYFITYRTVSTLKSEPFTFLGKFRRSGKEVRKVSYFPSLMFD